jgi:SAM-dependent methyltransferase
VPALPPDDDTDPERWGSWESPRDVHDLVAPELVGPVLDVGCGEGRLASLVAERGVAWVGLDSSPTQLADNPHRPVVQADMHSLPFRDEAFGEVAHLWWRSGPTAGTTSSRPSGPRRPTCRSG